MIEWLDDFYGSDDMRETLLRQFLPVFSGYVTDAVGPVSSSFVQALAESYVDRHLGSSRAQLQEVVKGADNPLADLVARFDEWEEKRPGKVAQNELVRSANAASVEKMREAGVTKKVWRASGGKTCPFCQSLDGTVIAVDGNYFEEGDELNPEGATAPIHFESSLGHPPVHQGCVCSVEAVEETKQQVTEKPQERYGTATSMQLHQVDGKWTPERLALHKRIEAQLLDGHTRHANREVYLTGGGPASGKGSFANFGRVPTDAATIDPDAIKALLPEYQQATAEGQRWAAAFAHEESSYLSKQLSLEATDRGLNLSLDTVGDGSISNLTHKIEALRTEGTRVVADYATIDTETAIERALARAERTGRYVPETYLRQAHAAVSDVLPRAVDANLFDEVRLWNTEARPATLIMSSIDGVTTIADPVAWDAFLAKAVQP